MAKSKKNKSKTSSNKTSVAVRRSPRVERGPPNAAEALEDEAAIDIMITAEKLADQNDQHDPDTAVDGMYTEVDPPLVTPKARKGSLRPGGSTKSGFRSIVIEVTTERRNQVTTRQSIIAAEICQRTSSSRQGQSQAGK